MKVTISKETRHRLRWTIFTVALVVFFSDMIAAIWPAFDKVWTTIAHIAVAVATVFASLAEWLGGMEESEVDNFIKEHEAKERAAEEAAKAPPADPPFPFGN